MKNLQKCSMALLCLTFSLLYSNFSVGQQSLTQINGWNAYVHLPASYSSSTASYPTIIFFPGLGEIGTNANALISNGPGAYINQGWNGNVVIDGTTVEFIVISIQPPSAYPNEIAINDKIQKIKSNYRVDNNKLYLTGLSHGGWCSTTFVTGDSYGGPYNYASQIAAVVEVQGVIPDDNSPYPNLFDNFASSGGRLLGLEQIYDNRGMPTRVNRMNATKPNSAIYVQTNFGGGGHCCWNQFYGGQGVQPSNFMLDGRSQNIYQWLARQSRNGTVAPTPPPVNQAPIANAGSDITVTLPTSAATLNGFASDADGSITSYQWTKISGPTGGVITNANAAQTTVTGLVEGVYQYQLQATDNSGATSTDQVQVTVNALVSLSPAVNPANTVNGLDYKYYEGSWSVLPNFDALTPVKTGSADNFDISVANRGDQFGFVFTGYISVPSDGIYTFYTTSDDGSKVWIDNQVVVDNDGLHGAVEQSGSIGLKAGKHYLTAQFFEQGGSQIFYVGYSGNGIGKQLMPSSVLFRVAAALPPPPPANVAPIANAGSNQSVTVNTATLSGSGTDTDGSIVSYRWIQNSGPSSASFVNANAASTSISGLVNGTYVFQLTVTDNAGAIGTASTQITVAIPQVPQTGGGGAGRSIRVNLFGGSNGVTDTKWNNWNISANRNSNNFLYEDRSNSIVSASLGGDIMVVDNGGNYATASTLPPSQVLRYNSAATSQRDLTIKGLVPGSKYYLEFYASRKNTGNRTLVTIDNQRDTINTDSNVFDYAKFSDITADPSGTITINISRIGTWNYLSGFSITEQSGTIAGRSIATATSSLKPESKVFQGETLVESLSKAVSVFPNPFVGFFKVELNNKTMGEYILRLSSQSGQTVYNKRILKQASPVIETINVSTLSSGVYILQVISVTTGNSVVHKVVKN